jgi:chromosome segregation ATPase
MADSSDGLTLEGLAQILRDHMDGTAARFAEVRAEFAEVRAQFAEVGARLDAVGARIDNLRGEIGTVATIVRDLAQIVARHDDEIDEHRHQAEEQRQYIRQIFARMEEHDARFEAITRDIRRILDAMERRGGNGGGREA